jgi:hypothetical protein
MKPRFTSARCRLLLVVGIACWTFARPSATPGADSRPADAAPYLAAVRQFAD